MKIQPINNNTPYSINNVKEADNGFAQVLQHQIENNKQKKNTETIKGCISQSSEQIRPFSVPNSVQISSNGLERLLKDASTITDTQILHEIESLCDDESGENINMEFLDELLEIYKDIKSNI